MPFLTDLKAVFYLILFGCYLEVTYQIAREAFKLRFFDLVFWIFQSIVAVLIFQRIPKFNFYFLLFIFLGYVLSYHFFKKSLDKYLNQIKKTFKTFIPNKKEAFIRKPLLLLKNKTVRLFKRIIRKK